VRDAGIMAVAVTIAIFTFIAVARLALHGDIFWKVGPGL
jgi:hypothetical protein